MRTARGGRIMRERVRLALEKRRMVAEFVERHRLYSSRRSEWEW